MEILLKESSLSIVILNFQAICVAPNTYVSPIHQFKDKFQCNISYFSTYPLKFKILSSVS